MSGKVSKENCKHFWLREDFDFQSETVVFFSSCQRCRAKLKEIFSLVWTEEVD